MFMIAKTNHFFATEIKSFYDCKNKSFYDCKNKSFYDCKIIFCNHKSRRFWEVCISDVLH